MSTEPCHRAWVEIDWRALRTNYDTVQRRAGASVGVIPMVKADGYGLGVEGVVRTLEPADPRAYGVATVREGVALRDLGIERTILVVTPIVDEECEMAVRSGLTLCLSDLDGVAALERVATRLGRRVPCHIEIDTGMGRSGFDWRRVEEWAPEISRSGPSLEVQGCFTHFQSAEAEDETPTTEQWSRFRETLDRAGKGGALGWIHACNSAATLRWPSFTADAVRPGIFLYGGRVGAETIAPKRVVSLRARVTLVREVEAGTSVGYGATFVTEARSRLATVSIGYGDGYRRSLGNRGVAIVRGVRVPVVGRISMDMTVVDVSQVDSVARGDVVTLIGADGEESVELDEVAEAAETIGYEILTGLSRRVERVGVEGRPTL